jgi:hypothetical protein
MNRLYGENMAPSAHTSYNACRSALIQGLVRSAPQAEPADAPDENGYVREAGLNLIEGVRLADFEADLRQGDGNELETKFRAAHSSSALAVNAFAPFKSCPAALRLPGGRDFTNLKFERKCPHGLARGRPPNLDVVAEGSSCVVAVESKCLEPLTPQCAKFAPAYDAEIRDGRRQTDWFQEMLRLVREPRAYRWLDAAQLVKHAFGLAYTFPDRPVTLLYLFWEPSNPEAYPIFAEHRAEVTRFAASVGGGPAFISMSYPELWRSWDACSEPDWLQAHVGRLRGRYGVAA